MKLQITERALAGFWSRVNKTESCWLWTGPIHRGYGYSYANPERGRVRAHIMSWAIANGTELPPAGMCVCHRCDVRNCVNPDHLFLGTMSDNMRDMHAKGRGNPPRGEDSKSAVLTEEIVRRAWEIRLATGRGPLVIARELGVKMDLIERVIYGKTWKHLRPVSA